MPILRDDHRDRESIIRDRGVRSTLQKDVIRDGSNTRKNIALRAAELGGPYALWRAQDYSGSGALLDRSGKGHDLQLGSTSGADTNDPLFLPFTGEKYLFQPGVALNGATTEYVAAFATTDLDVRVQVDPAGTWSQNNAVMMHRGDATLSKGGWEFATDATGHLIGWFSLNGTAYIGPFQSSVHGFAIGTTRWVRMMRLAATGLVSFFHSLDYNPVTLTGTWTPIGTATSTAGALFVSDQRPGVGGNRNTLSVNSFNGKILRAQLMSAIDGVVVAYFDSTQASQTSQTDAMGNVWTIHRSTTGRKTVIVDRHLFLLGTDDYFETPDHADLDFGIADSFTAIIAYRRTGTAAGTLFGKKLGIADNSIGYALYDDGNVALRIADGTLETVAFGARAETSVVVAAGRRDVAADRVQAVKNGVQLQSTADATTTTLENANVFRIGRLSGASGNFLDGEFIGAAVFRRVLTNAEINEVGVYLMAGRAA